MITFCKKNYGLMFVLVFLWGFQSVFFPLHHYHTESIHAHSGELAPHQHQGHLHSHTEEGQGSDGHEIDLHKSSLKRESPFKVIKIGDVQRSFINAQQMLFSFRFTDDHSTKRAGPPDSPKERSPPSFRV